MNNNKIEEIAKELKHFLPKENVYTNEPMSKHTTIKVGGPADIFIKVNSIEEIEQVISIAIKEKEPITVLGNGSNILVKDNGIRGIVIKICNSNYEFIDETTIKVGAGMLNAKLSRILLDNNLSGFEFACGIPGTIGGAVKMNAGAYGSQLQDLVVSTRYIDLEEINNYILQKPIEDEKQKQEIEKKLKQYAIKEITNEEHKFDYRKSIFSNKKIVIIDTTLKLIKSNKEQIQEKIDNNNKARKEKQPTDKPSCGSTFKRGKDFTTAKLIDECALKGLTVGGAQISTKHAGFVVNTGNATAKDIIELCEIIQQKVYEKFGKKIELEVEIIGE